MEAYKLKNIYPALANTVIDRIRNLKLENTNFIGMQIIIRINYNIGFMDRALV